MTNLAPYAAQLFQDLKTSPQGLSSKNIENLRDQYGYNLISHSDTKVDHLKIFLSQWKNPLVLILTIAGIVSGFVGHISDMTIIFGTVLVNTIVGFVQEDKANRALQKLSAMVEHKATVIRDGEISQIPSQEILPGDILNIEAGDSISADGQIIHEIELEVNEATLTGESMPVKKNTKETSENTSLGDRTNMVYRGTIVTNGKASVVVTATGQKTEIGKIAELVQKTPETETPLQKELSRLARQIGLVVIVIIIGMLILGFIGVGERYTMLELFQTAVAVAVAAIPEGLTISLTIILAIGMQFILKRHGLVRRLVSAETLGSISVICTDKTGTLTAGIMQVTELTTATESLDQSVAFQNKLHADCQYYGQRNCQTFRDRCDRYRNGCLKKF
jgi:Ca2+-transporting ATPase